MEENKLYSEKIKLNFTKAKIPKDMESVLDFTTPCLKNMQSSSNYSTNYASLDLVDDQDIIEQSSRIKEKLSSISVLIVVGIGGSNLGTLAIYEAMKAKYSNLKRLIFADTTDSFLIQNIIKEMKELSDSGEEIGLNVISKSGTTTETIANFYTLYEALEVILSNKKKEISTNEDVSSDKNKKSSKNSNEKDENEDDNENESEEKKSEDQEKNDEDHSSKATSLSLNQRVIVTTDKGSKLDLIANLKGFQVLSIPKLVGGRYSVFSNVGIFPLLFAGIDCDELLSGAKDIKYQCSEISSKNPALMSAAAIYNSYKQGKKIVNLFIFSKYLNEVGSWYRQLFAESLGKKMNANDTKEVRSGMMPMHSIGSTDLHSVAQLFLGGPNFTYHSFITIENAPQISFSVPPGFDSLIPSIENKSLEDIMGAIYGGVEKAFINENISFDNFHMNELDEYSLGALMQFKMMEVMILGTLLGVNPFDQPSVELYKQETRKLLDN